MPVPNEITYNDMNNLFVPTGCNGQGTKHEVDGALIRVKPCDCPVCESTKSERKQAYKDFEDRLAAVRRALGERKYDHFTKD